MVFTGTMTISQISFILISEHLTNKPHYALPNRHYNKAAIVFTGIGGIEEGHFYGVYKFI